MRPPLIDTNHPAFIRAERRRELAVISGRLNEAMRIAEEHNETYVERALNALYLDIQRAIQALTDPYELA